MGLVDHFLATDDKHFKQILLDTYCDYPTPEELFDVLIQRFREVPHEFGSYHVKRHQIIQAIVVFLQTVSPESNVLNTIRGFATDNNLTPQHREAITKAVESRSRTQIPRSYGKAAEPSNPYDIAIAFTLMEAELRQTVRWIDYLLHARDLPSRIDDLLSANEKMTRWLKFSVLRHDEIKGRADTIKHFAATAEACRQLHNYNSAGVIGSVLMGWKSKPGTDIPRTMDVLKKNTQESIRWLANLIEPDRNYDAHRKITKAVKAKDHIPWLPAHLADIRKFLASSGGTVEVDNIQLINFERYRKLADKVPGYQIPPDLQQHRQDEHISYLRHQFDTVDFDEETETCRLRKLKKREDEDYRTRRPQIRSLGF
ncbi:ras guanine nucleotide exchange factor domain-containing protein [Mycena olivaceomarginata]|nr:ras guanine nucleotide exchange factor domain-containing protein [Mycena olivaceomarginata]